MSVRVEVNRYFTMELILLGDHGAGVCVSEPGGKWRVGVGVGELSAVFKRCKQVLFAR